jgi:hypothetical protein
MDVPPLLTSHPRQSASVNMTTPGHPVQSQSSSASPAPAAGLAKLASSMGGAILVPSPVPSSHGAVVHLSLPLTHTAHSPWARSRGRQRKRPSRAGVSRPMAERHRLLLGGGVRTGGVVAPRLEHDPRDIVCWLLNLGFLPLETAAAGTPPISHLPSPPLAEVQWLIGVRRHIAAPSCNPLVVPGKGDNVRMPRRENGVPVAGSPPGG